jgi:hypothetical protein
MKKRQPVIHIGFGRCGSTFLQKKIFPNLSHYKFIEDIRSEEIIGSTDFWDLPGDLIFQTETEPYCYSNEGILPYTPVYYGVRTSRDQCIDNLLCLFKDHGEIFLQIRRQDHMALSLFNYTAPSFFRKVEDIFLDFPQEDVGAGVFCLKSKKGMYHIESLNYWGVISRFVSFFGANRVHVLCLEELKHDPRSYFERLSRIFDEDLTYLEVTSNDLINKSDETRARYPLNLGKIAKPFKGTFIESAGRRFFRRTSYMPSGFSRSILEYFKRGNEKIDDLFRLNMKNYGYFP